MTMIVDHRELEREIVSLVEQQGHKPYKSPPGTMTAGDWLIGAGFGAINLTKLACDLSHSNAVYDLVEEAAGIS